MDFLKCQQVTKPAALQSRPTARSPPGRDGDRGAGKEGSTQYTPALRRPQGQELRPCWGSRLEVGWEEESLTV